MPAIWYTDAHSMNIPGQLLIGLLAGLALVAIGAYPGTRFRHR